MGPGCPEALCSAPVHKYEKYTNLHLADAGTVYAGWCTKIHPGAQKYSLVHKNTLWCIKIHYCAQNTPDAHKYIVGHKNTPLCTKFILVYKNTHWYTNTHIVT